MGMAYKQHLGMACLTYMEIRTKLMPCNLESKSHLGLELNDEEKQSLINQATETQGKKFWSRVPNAAVSV